VLYRFVDVFLILSVLFICCIFYGQDFSKDWLIAGLLAATSFAFIAESVDLYHSWRIDSYIKIAALTTFSWCAVCGLLVLIAFFSKNGELYSRLVVGTWIVLTLLLFCSWRYLLRRVLFYIRARDHNTRSAAIIGVTDTGIKLAADLAKEPQYGIRLKGFYRVPDTDESDEPLSSFGTVHGDVSAAVSAAKGGELDQIYIALPMREELRISEILEAFSDTTATVHILPDFLVYNLLHSRWQQIGTSNLLSVYDTPIEGVSSWLKRLEDLVLSLLILTFISPLLLVIGLGVKLTSQGPALFKQYRYGLDGRSIEVWKFRSMTVQYNGDKVVQATRNDARITPFGKFLRRTSLDELPQFFNVLQGSMSIVGPRPHAVAHNEEYRTLISGYMLRHKVKPGITGWAQVNGWRGETDTLDKMHKRVEYDLYYIRNWSIWLDLRIVFMTVIKGFYGKNAY